MPGAFMHDNEPGSDEREDDRRVTNEVSLTDQSGTRWPYSTDQSRHPGGFRWHLRRRLRGTAMAVKVVQRPRPSGVLDDSCAARSRSDSGSPKMAGHVTASRGCSGYQRSLLVDMEAAVVINRRAGWAPAGAEPTVAPLCARDTPTAQLNHGLCASSCGTGGGSP